MQSVRAYISSNTFYSDICVGALSAIPRWKFAQKLESRGDEGCSKRLTKALTAFYEETRAITLSKNVLVEHVVNRDPMGNTLRMLIYGAMIRAYVYLVEKNDRVFAGSLYSLSSHFLSTHFGFYSLWWCVKFITSAGMVVYLALEESCIDPLRLRVALGGDWCETRHGWAALMDWV